MFWTVQDELNGRLNFLASCGYGESALCDGLFHSRLKQWVARKDLQFCRQAIRIDSKTDSYVAFGVSHFRKARILWFSKNLRGALTRFGYAVSRQTGSHKGLTSKVQVLSTT